MTARQNSEPYSLESMLTFQPDLSHLKMDSPLAHLPTHHFEVSPTTMSEIVAAEFERQPDLPGIIVVAHGQVLGAFSRRKFLERIGRPYGVEIYLKRPIDVILKSIDAPPLILPSDCPIETAAKIALERPANLVYEPIIVAYPSSEASLDYGDSHFSGDKLGHSFRLLNIYILLLAQSRLLNVAHETLQLRAQQLEQLNADKDKFFSIISHDLKGPFSPLLGMCELLPILIDQGNPNDIKQAGEGIYRSARNVYQLLENLLEWASLERGRMPFEPTNIKLIKIVQRNVSLLAAKAEEKQIELSYQVPSELQVYGDENLLDTVIRNLTTNALKFTTAGGQVKIVAQQQSHHEVSISVIDTGVGIPPDTIATLFQLGHNHSTKGTANEQGTGLGLILCKEMTEKNGGKIAVESVLGQGTTFSFTIPVAETKSGLDLSEADFIPDKVETETMILPHKHQPDLNSWSLPPLAELQKLRNLTAMGDMIELQKQAQELEAQDNQWQPFVHKLLSLIQEFDEEKIMALLNQ